MLRFPLRSGPTEELVWYVAEADALRRVQERGLSAIRAQLIAETRRWVMRDLRGDYDPTRNGSSKGRPRRHAAGSLADLLEPSGESTIEDWSEEEWEGFTLRRSGGSAATASGTCRRSSRPPGPPIRHRDLLYLATGEDTDSLVHDVLIRLCAAFLDQGFAQWQLPRRDEGFYRAFCAMYRRPWASPDRWLRGLAEEVGRLEDEGIGPLESIRESLEFLGVAEEEWDGFLSATFLALRGWGGMVWQVEQRGDRVVRPVPEGSLAEFLAVRLLLDRFALAHLARQTLGFSGPLAGFRDAARRECERTGSPSVEQRAILVFQLAQVVGLSPDVLHKLSRPQWATIVREIEAFSALERRRIFHLAYELRFYTQTLDAVAAHAPKGIGGPRGPGSRRPSASTSARSRSAATSRSSPPTSRPSGSPGSITWPSTTGGGGRA